MPHPPHAYWPGKCPGLTEEEIPTPFRVVLHFKGGYHYVFLATRFEPPGAVTSEIIEQAHARPGQPLVGYIDWSEVILIETSSIEEGG